MLVKKNFGYKALLGVLFLGFTFSQPVQARILVDMFGRKVDIPDKVEHVVCGGSGSLRVLTYLQGADMVVGVESFEQRDSRGDARPYFLANRTKFKSVPIIGEMGGRLSPEQLLSLERTPDVIFMAVTGSVENSENIQEKTGIPVVALDLGNLGARRDSFYASLRMMGNVIGKEDRAEEVISFFQASIDDLQDRARLVKQENKPGCYIGGVAYNGPHGLTSTEPGYPPFIFLNALNVAYEPSWDSKNLIQTNVSKESLLNWDPEVLFVDLSTLSAQGENSALWQLENDPLWQELRAVKSENVYGVIPYVWCAQNFDSTIVNSYYVGSVLYPEAFKDVDIKGKADQIYEFLVGAPVFDQLDDMFENRAFKRMDIQEMGR